MTNILTKIIKANQEYEILGGGSSSTGEGHEVITQAAYDQLTPAQKAEKVYMITEDGVPGSGLTAGAGIDITNNVISADMTTAVYDNTTSGATATNVQDAIDEVFQSVSNGKTLIAAAITDKGVPTAATDSFSTMATNIRAITTDEIIMGGLNLGKRTVSSKDGTPHIRNSISFKEGGKYYGCCIYDLEGASANSYEAGVYVYRKVNNYQDFGYTMNNITGEVSGEIFTVIKDSAFYTNGTDVKIVFIYGTTYSYNPYHCYEAVWDYKNTGTTVNRLVGRGESTHITDYNIDLTGYTQITNQDWVDSITGYNDNDNAQIAIVLKRGKPDIVGDNYIELSTNRSLDITMGRACYYFLDGADEGTYTTSIVSIPTGNHTVKIVPYTIPNGWASSFKLVNGVTTLIHDAPYSAYSTSATDTGADYKKEFAKNCTTLTSVPTETCTIPDTVTTIGDGFMYSMFEGCTGLTTTPTISISENVTSIGNDYMRRQFYGCTGLTTAATESMGDDVLTIGDYFMSERYSGCTGLTATTAEAMSDSVTTIGNYFANQKFYGCTGLTINQEEDLGNSLTTIGTNFRAGEYKACTGLLSTRNEVMPNTVTTILGDFRSQQFRGCSHITTVGEETLSSLITSIGDLFRYSQFYGCTAITNVNGWRDSTVGGRDYRDYQFYNCNTNKTVKVLTDVGYSAQSNTLNNTYVTEVQVPTAYLSNFTSTTTVYPRRLIDDSKFVGY